MGGHSIFVLAPGDKNSRVVFETLTEDGTRFALVQKYLPDIATGGDSRVLLIDGEPVPYALARIPSADDHRGNLAAGRNGVGRALNDRDRWLCQQIGPALMRSRHAVRRPGCDRRLRHRNQCHQSHRRTRARQAFGIDIGSDADRCDCATACLQKGVDGRLYCAP